MDHLKAVSLDAFGTIVDLIPPAPALARELREGWGIDVSEAEAKRALIAEITYYKAHHLEGRDEASLADLRLRCAAVLHENLPAEMRERAAPAEILPAMMRSLQFRPYEDVPAALKSFRAQGLAIMVVSNWDVSLAGVLERCGLAPYLDQVISSAAVGVDKPAPEPFERGLELLGLDPSSVVHIGDEPERDITGARAAGIKPVLIRRAGGDGPGPDSEVPVITTLADLATALRSSPELRCG